MAQKVQVVLVDDLDGGPADETVTFSLDGVAYEIDLSTENAAKLREAMATWVGLSRRVGGRAKPGRRVSGAPRRGSASGDVRAWGRANGFEVSERGRISAELRAAYDAAHPRG